MKISITSQGSAKIFLSNADMKKLGFTQLGVIPKGFLLKNGSYEDIIPHYIEL